MKYGYRFLYAGLFILHQCFAVPAAAQQPDHSLHDLKAGDVRHGFKIVSLYLNDANRPMGGRFIHEKTGFTLDLLQIESVPQTFIWVNTFPVSDRGEPHTQEHLLITKGNKGHELNTREGLSITQSNAFTSQLHTVYDFYTGAEPDVFYSMFEKYLDALLYPDYSDEEVHREVRNWGITVNSDKSLRLEEKGSVYNEMSTSMNNPYSILYDTLGRMLYGHAHPLSFNAGGLPAGIRELDAKAILKFHNDNYYLGNMGAITSVPSQMKWDSVLFRFDGILIALQNRAQPDAHAPTSLPAPRPMEKGIVASVGFPSENPQQTGTVMLAYPATRLLDVQEDVLLSTFLNVFAGDATSNLYKLFVDSKTKVSYFEAQSVSAYVDENQGRPIFFTIDGIQVANLTREKAIQVRDAVQLELKKISDYKSNSPELKAFNERFKNSLTSTARSYAKLVNSPPKFGYRNTYDEWYSQLKEINKLNDFEKSITLNNSFTAIRKLVSGEKNIWTTYLERWHLTTDIPYVAFDRPNPDLIAKSEGERAVRAQQELARLKTMYGLTDDQQTILRYKSEYDSNTTVLEKNEKVSDVRFIDNPPLSLDEQLNYKQSHLKGNIPLFVARFNNMTSATSGIALDMHTLPPDKLVYLALFPELLTQTGVMLNGKPVSYDSMSELLRQQILSLTGYYSVSNTSGRAELVIKASGNDATESVQAIGWMDAVLKQPYWEKENLPRIRDLVEQQLSQIRNTMQDAEENWTHGISRAYQLQDQPLVLITGSFLTREHAIFQLKWMLKESGSGADSTAIQNFLSKLAQADSRREPLKQLLTVMLSDAPLPADSAGSNRALATEYTALPAHAKSLAKEAAQDLIQILHEIPDTSLTTDWKYVCRTLQRGLAQKPEKTLADLNSVRRELLRMSNARVFMIGSEATEQKLVPELDKLFAGFDKNAGQKVNLPMGRLIDERVKSRLQTHANIIFAGLINPNSQTGVISNSAPLTSLKDTSREKLLEALAAGLYAGSGKQSVYSRVVGAGLSYGGGVAASLNNGQFNYYAERTPELPQTLRYVISELKRAPMDTTLCDYVVAQTIGYVNAANEYELRGEMMANALLDGITPELVKQFRLNILRLRKDPRLIYDIYTYKDRVNEKVLPGYGTASRNVPGGSYLVIGPEKQMISYETYLKSVDGPDTQLFRLYPRDFWFTIY